DERDAGGGREQLQSRSHGLSPRAPVHGSTQPVHVLSASGLYVLVPTAPPVSSSRISRSVGSASRNACTTSGSNWRPDWPTISSAAYSHDSAPREGRPRVIASRASATENRRPPSGISSPRRRSGYPLPS